MSDNEDRRRCMVCHKILLDEKIPVCQRCQLKGWNIAKQAGGVVAFLGVSVVGGVAAKGGVSKKPM